MDGAVTRSLSYGTARAGAGGPRVMTSSETERKGDVEIKSKHKIADSPGRANGHPELSLCLVVRGQLDECGRSSALQMVDSQPSRQYPRRDRH